VLARLTRPNRRHGVRRLAAVLALAATILLPTTVAAEPVLQLDGTVTDTTGELADDTAAIEAVSRRVAEEHGVQAFVVFVATTDGAEMPDYAFETAAANSLGVNDALLVVAIEDRTDFIWVSDGLDQITDDELDEIIGGTLEPALADGEFGRAVNDTIEALGEAADSAQPTDGPLVPGPATFLPNPDPGAGEPGDAGGGIDLGTILGLGLIGGGAFLFFRWWRGRQDGTAGAAPAGVAAPALAGPELAQRANALLIATDERIRDAQQEVGFAEAQYGSEAVVPLQTAVGTAQGELREAFKIRQQLDDEVPEDAATRDAMLRAIVDRTTRAQDVLDDETDRIRQLRDLERDAPNTLVELPGRIEAVEDRLPAAASTFAGLQRYAATTWQPVAGHLEEAQKGLDGARDAVIVGSRSMSGDDRSEVALATREALEGVTGAATLLDAVERLAASVAEAETRVPAELAEGERDLTEARSAVERGVADTTIGGRVAEVENALAAARGASTASPGDPIEALRLATEAHRLADALLLDARGAAEARTRLVAAAESSIRTAASEIDRAATYIASRRPGVGETARTRLAEAQRLVGDATALAASDPAQALEVGRRAQALANEAYRIAQSDFNDFDQGGPGWGQRSGPSGDQTAQILGQILGGIIGGAVRSGGGWGGSPWGSGGRSGGGGGLGGLGGLGGGWGGGGGGFGSGGFGGGGGGGGRGRGGRW
jgi:hypothetical protein